MEITNAAWKNATSKIFTGVLLFSLAGIAGVILGAIALFSGSLGGVFIITLLVAAATVIGYVLYLMGLNNFKGLLQGEDSVAINRVWQAAILALAGVLVALIPVVGAIIGGIIGIIAYVLNVMAFNTLKTSPTFPALAKSGASKLFIAYVLYLVGVICTMTVFLAAIGGILNLIALIMILIGWSNIKNTNPEV